jgi:uncharacterized membrane protein
MMLLIAGLIVFLGVHSVAIVAPGLRASMRARLGEGGWKALYSVVSLAGFVAICYGFGLAREAAPVVLYSPPFWLRHVTLLLMLPVFPLLFAAHLPGRIKSAAKHPMLAGVKLWAFAHLLSNGRLVDVLLFGSFLAWAVVDRISLKRRPAQAVRDLPARPWNDAVAILAGLAFYALFVLWAHLRLFGVAPMGRSF